MSLNLGINLVEVNGATPSIQGAPTSVAGFVIRSQRGVPSVVREVSSFRQFTDYFGGYVAAGNTLVINGQPTQTSYVGAYALQGFFDNGGTLAYVMRIVDPSTAKAAALSFPTTSGGTTIAITLTAAYRGQADPGSWGNSIAIAIVANTSNPNVKDAFDLTVAQAVTVNGSTTYKVLETWSRISMSGAAGYQQPSVLNDPNTGSKYVMVTVATSGTPPVPNGPPAPTPTTGTGSAATNYVLLGSVNAGVDDSLVTGTSPTSPGTLDNWVVTNALSAPSPFDSLPIELLACPESSVDAVASAALTYCINRGDCMFVGHVPAGYTQTAARGYGQSFQADKVYGALYYPYIQVADPIGSLIWIPPTGHVLGVYARTDQQRGIWKAPAGDGALVQDALDVATRLNDTDHTDLVKNGSVNAIRPITGSGIVIDSSRTLSTNTLWLYVNVRLLFNYVKSSLRSGLRWVVQEPNDATLWNQIIYNSVTPFLMGLWRQGAFGSGKPSDLFTVKVDAVNNPPASVQQGILNIEVYFYPSRPAETIVITVGQQQGASTAAET